MIAENRVRDPVNQPRVLPDGEFQVAFSGPRRVHGFVRDHISDRHSLALIHEERRHLRLVQKYF